jgi:hypothetical protein
MTYRPAVVIDCCRNAPSAMIIGLSVTARHDGQDRHPKKEAEGLWGNTNVDVETG